MGEMTFRHEGLGLLIGLPAVQLSITNNKNHTNAELGRHEVR